MFHFHSLLSGPPQAPGAPDAALAVASGRPTSHVYRPDIDGLRALAVLSVVLFHLDVGLAKGGFVGVDVFFVISGYLITNIIRVDIALDRFSIVAFYDRRIRRIFPALLAMMLAATLATLLFLLPPDIVDFSKSTIAALLFVSNMYFMSVTDYFNASGDANMLLHTWSLAVEEQFYVVFPLLLFMLRHASRRTLLTLLCVLGGASFVLSIVLVRTDQVAAFYLSPSRAWELLLGSVIALGAVPPLRRPWVRDGVACLGVVLIIASAMVFYANMPFPGTRALMPCLGAACVIQAGASGAGWTSRALSSRPLVFIGLISYSLYLWHWPLIVFARMWWLAPLDPTGKTLLFLASIAAGWMSWWFVERPFRLKRLLARPLALRLAASAGMTGVLLCAGVLLASNGLASMFPPAVNRLAGFIHYDDRPVYRRGSCFLDSHVDSLADYDAAVCRVPARGHRSLIVIGDSHAAHLWSGLKAQFPETDVLQATASGCKPVFDAEGPPTCVRLIDDTLHAIMTNAAIDTVILSARWSQSDIPSVIATIDRLAPHVGRLYVAGPIVEYREALPRLLAMTVLRRQPAPLFDSRLTEPLLVDDSLRAALMGHAATYLSAYRALCPSPTEQCLTTAADGTPLQWDYGHLTAQGSDRLVGLWRREGRLTLP